MKSVKWDTVFDTFWFLQNRISFLKYSFCWIYRKQYRMYRKGTNKKALKMLCLRINLQVFPSLSDAISSDTSSEEGYKTFLFYLIPFYLPPKQTKKLKKQCEIIAIRSNNFHFIHTIPASLESHFISSQNHLIHLYIYLYSSI